MRIIIDAMGGDSAPYEIVKGAVEAIREFDIDITLVGDKDKIEEVLQQEKYKKDKIDIVHTTEVITNCDSPTLAIRTKKDSSMVVGMKLLKDGIGSAFISAGNTGAILAGGLLIVGRIKGIDRPALAPILPGKNGPMMLLDAGANAECKPYNILQFGVMGEVYFNKVLNKDNPSVALVNIGSEEEKGTDLTKKCYSLLRESGINFRGNIEAREIPKGNIDIILCDGFVGNVILKLFEGMAQTIFDTLKEEIMSSFRGKVGGTILNPTFKRIKKKLDYTEYGGAILLGTEVLIIKAHGNSNAKAIKNAIRQAVLCVDGRIVESIKNEIEKYNF